MEDELSEDEQDTNIEIPGGVPGRLQLPKFHTSRERFNLRFLWQTYWNNIDPVLKVLHIPTTERLIELVYSSPEHISPCVRCLLSAVQFAAVTSLTDVQCQNAMGIARDSALSTLRNEVKESLDAAKLITSHSLTNLQAYVIFLVSICFEMEFQC